jgi:transaldolase
MDVPCEIVFRKQLVLGAYQKDEYKGLVKDAVAYAEDLVANGKVKNYDEAAKYALDMLMVKFGIEILKIIPGRVSTELDSRQSFDTEATIQRARRVWQMYRGSLGYNWALGCRKFCD